MASAVMGLPQGSKCCPSNATARNGVACPPTQSASANTIAIDLEQTNEKVTVTPNPEDESKVGIWKLKLCLFFRVKLMKSTASTG